MCDRSIRPDGVHPRMEKYILRKAFDTPERPFLPESVLWRQKEQFSDGVGCARLGGGAAVAAGLEGWRAPWEGAASAAARLRAARSSPGSAL